MKKSLPLFILLGLLSSSVAFAQEPKTEEVDPYSLSLEEISNIRVNPPSKEVDLYSLSLEEISNIRVYPPSKKNDIIGLSGILTSSPECGHGPSLIISKTGGDPMDSPIPFAFLTSWLEHWSFYQPWSE